MFSRRLSIVVGQFLFALAYIVQGAIPVFGVILTAEVARGIGETCLSGARQAWLAGEVGTENVGELRLRGTQAHRWGSLAGIAASVALANFDLRAPIVSGGALSLVLGVALTTLMPERAGRPTPPRGSRVAIGETLHTAVAALRKSNILRTLFILAAILGAASEGFDRLWEAHILTSFALPHVGALGPVTWFGLIDAGGLLIAVGAIHVVRGLDTSSDRGLARTLIVLQFFRAIAIGVLALTSQLGVAILARWLTQGLQSVSVPLIDAWLARTTPPQARATIYSAISQGDALGQVAGGPGIGAIGKLWSLRVAILASGALLLPGVLLLQTTRTDERLTAQESSVSSEQNVA